MTEYIYIEVPEEGTDLEKFFEAKLKNAEFRRTLDLDVEQLDERAHQWKVEVAEVLEDEDGNIEVAYDVHWDAYHGCSDANLSGEERRETVGRREGSTWLFEIYVPPPQRTSFEEF